MENVKLKLPTKLSAIKLKDFQKYMSIVENNPDADRNFLEIKLMEIFCQLKYKNIEGLPFGIFDDSVTLLNQLFQSNTPLIRRFTMKGTDGVVVEFGFIPNLDKITMGEYIDLTNYINDYTTLNKAMAVLFRPIHESYRHRVDYKVSSYKGTSEHAEILKDMPVDIALGAKVFFWTLGNKLLTIMLNSLPLQEDLQAALSEGEKKDLIASMRGIKNSMLLQEVQHYESMKLL